MASVLAVHLSRRDYCYDYFVVSTACIVVVSVFDDDNVAADNAAPKQATGCVLIHRLFAQALLQQDASLLQPEVSLFLKGQQEVRQ